MAEQAPNRPTSPPAPPEEDWHKTHHVSHVHTYTDTRPDQLSGERAFTTEGMAGRGSEGVAEYKAASAAGVHGMGASSATGKQMGQEPSGMADYNASEAKCMEGEGAE